MAAFSMDAGYAMMTVNSQIIYKPTDQRDDPEPDNDHEVYVGNLPPHYTIEKFVRLAKNSGSIYSVRILKGCGGLNKGFGYIMYRNLDAVDKAIEILNGTFLPESDSNKPLIVQKSLCNTIMMIYGFSKKNNNKYFIRKEINFFMINYPSLLLKFECEDDTKLFISFKSLKAAQIFKKKMKDSFNTYGVKMYYFNDTENWVRWEDLKKNISINPQGNRVRFVPIVPNNINRFNALPPSSPPKSLLFKRFIPKHMTNCSSKENINSTQLKNDQENKNISSDCSSDSLHYAAKFSMKNYKSASLQFSQYSQEKNKHTTSTSFTENSNMNVLKNSSPKLPLRTIWNKDNRTEDFKSILPSKNNSTRNPFSSDLNCLSQTISTTNYVVKSKLLNEAHALPNSLTTVNNPKYFKPSYLVSPTLDQKLYTIPEEESTNSSFFTSDNDKLSSTSDENINILEQNSFNFINHPFNIGDIWKDYRSQPPRI